MNKYLILLALAFLLMSCVSKDNKPNVVFVMSDDHAYQAISAYGGTLNRTPNIDRLAQDGALFTRATVTNSICSPSRAVMLTGKHSFVNGRLANSGSFDWGQDNVAKQFKAAGYQTAMIGKIHLPGLPQGFDHFSILEGQGKYYNPDFIQEGGKKKRYKGYCAHVIWDQVKEWLDTREEEKPFFLMYHPKAPHRTWMPEPRYFDLFEDKEFEIPASFYDDYKNRPSAAKQKMSIVEDMDLCYDLKMLDKEGEIKSRYRRNAQNLYNRMDDKQKAAWDKHYEPLIKEFKQTMPKGKELAQWKYNRYMRDYLSSIQSVDDGVGKLLDYLEENNLDENTIVVYTSDQGFYLGEHGWFDKRFMYEQSFRTPLLMKYPKEIKPGTTIDALVQNLDFASTFMDFAGIDIPSDIQGESFRKLVNNTDTTWRDFAYYTFYEYPGEHNVNRHYGITTKRYKLIHFYYDEDNWELYDLKEDPQEINNLYNHEDYQGIRTMMHQKLDDVRAKYGDNDDLNQEFLQKTLEAIEVRKKKKKQTQ
jgi:arylsulfatase A-like enzyme